MMAGSEVSAVVMSFAAGLHGKEGHHGWYFRGAVQLPPACGIDAC